MPPQSSALRQGASRASKHDASGDTKKHRQHHQSEPQSHPGHPEGPPLKKQRTRQSSIASSTTKPTAPSTRKPSIIPPSTAGHNNTTSASRDQGNTSHGSIRGVVQSDGSGENTEKRTLRSQVGTSSIKSVLEQYIPDYYEIVLGPLKDPVLPDADSVFYLVDPQAKKTQTSLAFRTREPVASRAPAKQERKRGLSDAKPTLQAAPFSIFDWSAFEDEALDLEEDPLDDSIYHPYHARGERRQKKERNVEKERSAHEKEQLKELYNELRGPDWLRTMGITGVTDTEKKSYEPKRDICLVKVKTMLSKFDDYREQEKTLKRRRDRAAAAAAALEDEEEDDADDDDAQINGELTTYADLDESALQLQQEASLATTKPPMKLKLSFTPKGRRGPKGKRAETSSEPDKPFNSFFAKPHERAGAMAKHRRGRRVMAFGQPLPELPENKFFTFPEGKFEKIIEKKHGLAQGKDTAGQGKVS